MGKVGYIIFNVATLFTLFGLAMGTMVVTLLVSHPDRDDGLPRQSAHPQRPPAAEAVPVPDSAHRGGDRAVSAEGPLAAGRRVFLRPPRPRRLPRHFIHL